MTTRRSAGSWNLRTLLILVTLGLAAATTSAESTASPLPTEPVLTREAALAVFLEQLGGSAVAPEQHIANLTAAGFRPEEASSLLALGGEYVSGGLDAGPQKDGDTVLRTTDTLVTYAQILEERLGPEVAARVGTHLDLYVRPFRVPRLDVVRPIADDTLPSLISLEPPPPPNCAATCSATRACSTPCLNENEDVISCGAFGLCEAPVNPDGGGGDGTGGGGSGGTDGGGTDGGTGDGSGGTGGGGTDDGGGGTDGNPDGNPDDTWPGPQPNSTAAQACRASGFGTATDSSYEAHLVHIERVTENYMYIGEYEGHDGRSNLLTSVSVNAANICNVSRGNCSGPGDTGCPLNGLMACSGQQGDPACAHGETCFGRWSATGHALTFTPWLQSPWVPLGVQAISQASSFAPVDCDCASATSGFSGSYTAISYNGVFDESSSRFQSIAQAVSDAGRIESTGVEVLLRVARGYVCKDGSSTGIPVGIVPISTEFIQR